MTGSRGWRGTALLAAVATALQLYGLYRPSGPPSPPWFPHVDKLQHALGFALPVALLLLALGWRAAERGGALARRAVTVVVGAFALHAVVSELVQHYCYVGRTGDPWDVVADWTGVGLGTAAGLAGSRATRAARR